MRTGRPRESSLFATREPVLPVAPSTSVREAEVSMTPSCGLRFELINALYAHLITRYAHVVDILQDHLARARASGGVFARSVARPPWGLRLPGTIQLALHTVVQGRAWLWLEDPRAALELAPGDLALVPGGPDHHIAHQPDAVCISPERFREQHADDEHIDHQGATVFLCGAYRFSGDVGRGLIRALPPVLLLRARRPRSTARRHRAALTGAERPGPRAADRSRPPARCPAGAGNARLP